MTSTENILSSLENRERGVDSPIRFAHRLYSSESIVRRFQITKRLSFHDGCINALSFNRSGSLLLSGSDDLKVCLWDWVHQKPACYYESRHKANVLQCRFMPFSNDCMIVTSGMDGQVRLTELDNAGLFRSSKRILRHTGSCHKIIINEHNPQCVLSCGEDAHIRLIDLRTPSQTLRSIVVMNESRHAVPLFSIAVRPLRLTEFAACGMDRWIRIFDNRFTKTSCGTLLKKFCPIGLQNSSNSPEIYSHITSVAYSHDGEELIASYHNDRIFLFDTNHSTDEVTPVHTYKGHCNFDTVKGVNFYGSGSEYIISGSDCGHLFIWSKDTEKIIWYAKAEDSGPTVCTMCKPRLRECWCNHLTDIIDTALLSFMRLHMADQTNSPTHVLCYLEQREHLNIVEPHPAFPMIATSGFDYCAKIWEPTRTEAVPLDKLDSMIEQNRTRDFGFSDDTDLLLRVLRPLRNRHSRNMRISQAMIIPMGIGNRSIRIPMELNNELVELITAIGYSPTVLDLTHSANSTDESSTNHDSNQALNALTGDDENSDHSSWEDFESTDADNAFSHRTDSRYARVNRNSTRSIILPRRRRRRASLDDQVARRDILHRPALFSRGRNFAIHSTTTSDSSSQLHSDSNSTVENRIYSLSSNNSFIADSDINIAFSSSTNSSGSEHSVDDAMDTD